MTGLWLALFDCSDCCLCDTSSGGVKAMLDVGYDRPAAQPHAPEDDILQPSISGRDSIPADRYQAQHMCPVPDQIAVLS